jgi:hypothetical protein
MSHVHSTFRAFVAACAALFVLSACSGQMEPAKKAIADIETAITAAGADAQQYIPDQLKSVNDQLTALKAKFDQKDYKAVVAEAPPLLARAQGLAAAKDLAVKEAAARAAEAQAAAEQALRADWDALAGTVPAAIEAVESRAAILAKSKKLPPTVTKDALAAAQSGVAEAKSLWDQATGAQAAGNWSDAVAAAQQAKSRVDEALTGLGMSAG